MEVGQILPDTTRIGLFETEWFCMAQSGKLPSSFHPAISSGPGSQKEPAIFRLAASDTSVSLGYGVARALCMLNHHQTLYRKEDN